MKVCVYFAIKLHSTDYNQRHKDPLQKGEVLIMPSVEGFILHLLPTRAWQSRMKKGLGIGRVWLEQSRGVREKDRKSKKGESTVHHIKAAITIASDISIYIRMYMYTITVNMDM